MTTQELRERLRERALKVTLEGRRLRLYRKACAAAGDYEEANRARHQQVHYYRPRARGVHLAYAFAKGRTRSQAEGLCDPENEPYGLELPPELWEWDEAQGFDTFLFGDWLDAKIKTLDEVRERAVKTPEPVPAPVVEKPSGFIGWLRAAVGLG